MCFWAIFLAPLYRNDYEITLLKSPKEKVEHKTVCLNENGFKREILELLSFNTLAI